MKRFQSAFAAPSGFVVAGKTPMAGRRTDAARVVDLQAPVATFAKTRDRDVRDRNIRDRAA